jgi:hypothetical protein
MNMKQQNSISGGHCKKKKKEKKKEQEINSFKKIMCK